MISVWHLLWIIPISASAGALCMAVAAASGGYEHAREHDELYKK